MRIVLNCHRVLQQWQERCCCFNDDMQGTAAVTLAGLLAGLRAIGETLDQQTFLFLGAGEAGTGRTSHNHLSSFHTFPTTFLPPPMLGWQNTNRHMITMDSSC